MSAYKNMKPDTDFLPPESPDQSVIERESANLYAALFSAFREYLGQAAPVGTKAITSTIKEFFRDRFTSEYAVHLSDKMTTQTEYLTDVLVTTFLPRAVFKADRSFSCIVPSFQAILAVESELGGSGASSAGGIMRNVVADYLKLMLIRSKYRVMVFTSLRYANDPADHVPLRVKTLREIYLRTDGIEGGALLIHLDGRNGEMTAQVQVSANTEAVRGFLISPGSGNILEL